MKKEDLSDAIGNLDEKLVVEADQVRKKKHNPRWIAWVAAAACIAVAVAVARPMFMKENAAQTQEQIPLGKPNNTILYDVDSATAANLIAYAKYPEQVKCPNMETYGDDWEAYNEAHSAWLESRSAYRKSLNAVEDETYFDDFYQTSALEFLSDAENQNVVYSPSNVYMALAMLAELTDGQSRQQILDLLGAESIEQLREEAKYLWSSNYCDDGMLTTVMANSLWMDENLPYNQETMDLIAEEYYASSYHGNMGSGEYDALLRDWLNKQTGGLLKDQVDELSFDPQTVMALASTIYFKGQWTEKFSSDYTAPDTFHAATGDVTVDFMNSSDVGLAYWGESFTAIQKSMDGNAAMWLILPDEGKTVADVLADGEIFEMTAAGATWEQNKYVTINLAMPKFDVLSNMDLVSGLQNLGVTDVFDYTVSDFTPMSAERENVYVSNAEHAARVMVDEDGCTAAAYTVMMAEGTAICEDEIDFELDRPFIFVITGCGDQPLFIGVVNQM